MFFCKSHSPVSAHCQDRFRSGQCQADSPTVRDLSQWRRIYLGRNADGCKKGTSMGRALLARAPATWSASAGCSPRHPSLRLARGVRSRHLAQNSALTENASARRDLLWQHKSTKHFRAGECLKKSGAAGQIRRVRVRMGTKEHEA